MPTGDRVELSILVESGQPLATQIYGQIRQAILDGRLTRGAKLPSSRDLARQLGVSRNTVLVAYERLVAEGYLDAATGSGTFVSTALSADADVETPADESSPVESDRHLSSFARRLRHPQPIVPRRDLPYDFRPGVPELADFPIDTWRRIATRQLRSLSRSLAYYGDTAGLWELRRAIAQYLGYSRAVACRADDLIITSGTQQALDLIARVTIEPGRDTVAVEEPGYPAALAVFRAMGARVVPTPVDVSGIRVDAIPPEARLIYVTPSHQFPLGVTLSLARRRALLQHAVQHGSIVIEDDYDSEFRYDTRPLDSLQGLDRGGSVVIYVGSFSKVLFPGLRLGYIVAPPSLRPALLAAKWITDRHTEAFEQHVMATFINEGHFTRYLRRMQRSYAARRAALLEAVRRWAPWIEPLPSSAGLHLTGLVPPGLPVEELTSRAAATGVGIYSIALFYHQAGLDGLMFGFGACTPTDINEGIRRLANVHAALGFSSSATKARTPVGRSI